MQSNNGPWKIQWMLSVICYEMINTHRISCFKRNLHLVQLTWIARCLFILCDDNIGANTGSIRLPMATNYSNVGQHCSHVWPQSLKHDGKQTLGNDVDLTTSWLSSETSSSALFVPCSLCKEEGDPGNELANSPVHIFSIIPFSIFQIHETSNQQQVRTQRGCIGWLATPHFGSFLKFFFGW